MLVQRHQFVPVDRKWVPSFIVPPSALVEAVFFQISKGEVDTPVIETDG